MNFEPILLSALTAGLLGSLHCAGMCGGIATALGMGLKETSASEKPTLAALFFQFGRISSYVVAGLIAGYFGDVLTHSSAMKGITIYLRLFSAIFMIGLGLYLAGWLPIFSIIEKAGIPVWKKISPLSRYFLPVKHIPQAYALGFLWGWIPCGLTYSILLWSVTAGGAIQGASLMLAFGLGTIPAMLPLTLGAGKIHRLVKQKAIRIVAGLLIVIGGVYILQHSIMMLNMNHSHPPETAIPKHSTESHSAIHSDILSEFRWGEVVAD